MCVMQHRNGKITSSKLGLHMEEPFSASSFCGLASVANFFEVILIDQSYFFLSSWLITLF